MKKSLDDILYYDPHIVWYDIKNKGSNLIEERNMTLPSFKSAIDASKQLINGVEKGYMLYGRPIIEKIV